MRQPGVRRFWRLAALPLIVSGCGLPSTSDDEVVQPADDSPTAKLIDSGPRDTESSSGTAPEDEAHGGEGEFSQLLADLGVVLHAGTSSISVKGWVNMQTGLVEVFACVPEGKTHESVVVLDCVPSGLHAGLLALGLTSGTPVEHGTDGTYERPTGDGVDIHVKWKGLDGADRLARAEDWVWNHETSSAMKHGSWVFAGSFLQESPGSPGDRTYAANYVKSLVTTYHDSSSVLENPHVSGIDDTIYYANDRAVPAVGTPVTVVFSAGRTARASEKRPTGEGK